MRIGTSYGLILPLGLWMSFAAGCGAPVIEFQPDRTSAATLRVELNPTAEGEIASLELLGLTAEEQAAFQQLEAPQQAEAFRVYVVGDGSSALPPCWESIRSSPRGYDSLLAFPFRQGCGAGRSSAANSCRAESRFRRKRSRWNSPRLRRSLRRRRR